jgi:hypothetical protein
MPDPAPKSHGNDTPNSLRSYSPSSSIRGVASDIDYTESHPFDATRVPEQLIAPTTPMTESAMTLVPAESPQETLVASPVEEHPQLPEPEQQDSPPIPASLKKNKASKSDAAPCPATVAVPPPGKALLGKGKIDPKAQDDFIAYMLAKN